jgi:hypothetical protein
MRNFAFRLLTLLCAPGAMMMAQTATVHTTTSFGTGVVLPSFLPPAPPAADPVAYWSAYLGLSSAQQASVKTILSDQQNSTNSLKAKVYARFYAVLTPDQQQKFDILTALPAAGAAGTLTVVSSGEASSTSANQ